MLRKKLDWGFAVLGVVFLAAGVGFRIALYNFSVGIFFWNMPPKQIVSSFLVLSVLCFAGVLLMRVHAIKRLATKRLWLFGLMDGAVALAAGALILTAWGSGFRSEPKLFMLQAPDNACTVIVEEETSSAQGKGTFYIQTGPCTMEKAGEYTTTSGFRPFSLNRYQLEWKAQGVIVTYEFSDGGETRTADIRFAE